MCEESRVAPKEAAGAPEMEIEVTPEMIKAGISHLFDYDPSFSNERDIVREIFLSMSLASRPNSKS